MGQEALGKTLGRRNYCDLNALYGELAANEDEWVTNSNRFRAPFLLQSPLQPTPELLERFDEGFTFLIAQVGE